MHLVSSVNIAFNLSQFLESSREVDIFAPFIKLDTLKAIFKSVQIKKICVRWHLKDLVEGSSDLELFLFCQEKGIPLYRNPRIHLKAFTNDNRQCFFGSANISSRGMSNCTDGISNFELCGLGSNLGLDDYLYFQSILDSSIIVTQEIYEELKIILAIAKEQNVPENKATVEKVFKSDINKDFLISSLPLSSSTSILYKAYEQEFEGLLYDEVLNAVHDLAIYQVPNSLSQKDFFNHLKKSFFKQPFINQFVNDLVLNHFIHFGRAKEWIQENCANVPLPTRWELTSNTQILFKWFEELGSPKFSVDIPGKRSQRIKVNVK